MHVRCRYVVSTIAALLFASALSSMPPAADEATVKQYSQMSDKAVAFLGTKAQAADGSFNAQAGPAVTALVATALLKHGRSPEDPVVAKALKYVEGFVHDDGGIYGEGNHKNYETCIAVLLFKEA